MATMVITFDNGSEIKLDNIEDPESFIKAFESHLQSNTVFQLSKTDNPVERLYILPRKVSRIDIY